MKLQTLQEWGQDTFEDPPQIATLRRWARAGVISGARKIGRTYYVPAGAELAGISKPALRSDDPVINQILSQ